MLKQSTLADVRFLSFINNDLAILIGETGCWWLSFYLHVESMSFQHVGLWPMATRLVYSTAVVCNAVWYAIHKPRGLRNAG